MTDLITAAKAGELLDMLDLTLCPETSAALRTIISLTAQRDAARAELARVREALAVYADSCDATETTPCGYEGNLCCKTARAALTTQEDKP